MSWARDSRRFKTQVAISIVATVFWVAILAWEAGVIEAAGLLTLCWLWASNGVWLADLVNGAGETGK